ncbi:Spy/CpxP family protein refolding chaperone [Bowmanella denitrificans]|uniref:Spy/CpxP family protein refolding chaperone n=1 Tax=Bowmanella denitrificans TaxID=366582 RepID=UPI000C99FCA8|nr:Spy/CpxP family protein refolding chaperone [Bowmanella denitrificans]
MKPLTKLLLPLVVGLTFGAAVQAKEPPRGHLFKMFEALQLSEQQRQDIRTLFKQGREDMGVFREDRRAIHEQMQVLIKADNWDAQAAQTLLEQSSADRQAAMWGKAQMRQAVWQVLTSDQREQWQDIQEQRFDGPRGEPFNGRWLKKLELTDEQQQKLETLQVAASAARQQSQTLRQGFADAELDLIEQGKLNEQNWQALYNQYQPQFLNLELQKLAQRHDFYQLLSEDQRSALQQRMEKRQKHKHRQS